MPISQKLVNSLHHHRTVAMNGGGAEKIQERRDKGMLSARDRLNVLFQENTFQEVGMHIRHNATAFGMSGKDFPADGVVAGTGYVDGRQVVAFSQDFTVGAGTVGKQHARKIVQAMHYAFKAGVPLVAMKDSGGARIQEGVDALSGYGCVFYQNVLLSGVVPQIALVLGPCAGGAAYSPALMDFVIMTRHNARMFITGPEVIKAVTGQSCTMDEVGGAMMHATVSGNAHFVAEDDEQAVAIAKALLSYMPSNNTEDPPHRPWNDLPLEEDEVLNNLMPEDPAEPIDIKVVIDRLVDAGSFLEVHASWAQNIVVGFARIGGLVVGVIANQPQVLAGVLDMDASDKAARFVRFCNVFNIPLVTLVDVPGFLPGVAQERGGIIRHGAKMLFAYASATVPKITIILRKAYGGSYLAMCAQEMGADMVFAWPTAEIAVMGAEGAVNILYRKALGEASDRRARSKELAEQYRDQFASPYVSAERGYITDVIMPSETRANVVLALRKLLNKRELRPPKKHGNIPL